MISQKFEEKLRAIPYSREKRAEYHEKISELTEEFKEALFEEYDLKDNPRKEKLWEISYSLGHSNGFSETENYFLQLMELII